jgi:hypothetical protein
VHDHAAGVARDIATGMPPTAVIGIAAPKAARSGRGWVHCDRCEVRWATPALPLAALMQTQEQPPAGHASGRAAPRWENMSMVVANAASAAAVRATINTSAPSVGCPNARVEPRAPDCPGTRRPQRRVPTTEECRSGHACPSGATTRWLGRDSLRHNEADQ